MTTPFPAPSPAIAARYSAWMATRRAWLATLSDDPRAARNRGDVIYALLRRHVDVIASLCPTSRDDLAVQLHVHWIEHGPHWQRDDAHVLDDAEPQDRYVAMLWRAVAGRDGWPRGPAGKESELQ